MRIRLTNERNVIKIANVQGRARLLKGLLAKLSRLFTAQILSGCDKDSRAGFTFEAYRPTQMSATGRSRLQGRVNLTRPGPTRGSEKYYSTIADQAGVNRPSQLALMNVSAGVAAKVFRWRLMKVCGRKCGFDHCVWRGKEPSLPARPVLLDQSSHRETQLPRY
jgi:hypothetical protein